MNRVYLTVYSFFSIIKRKGGGTMAERRIEKLVDMRGKGWRVASILEDSTLYTNNAGTIAQLFNDSYYEWCSRSRVNYVANIFNTSADDITGIVTPTSAIYYGNKCVGQTWQDPRFQDPKARTLEEEYVKMKETDPYNLKKYSDLYGKLEAVVKQANKKDIVIPTLATLSNVWLLKGNKIRILRSDLMQYGEEGSFSQVAYLISKCYPRYMADDKFEHLYKLIDKRSLTTILLNWAFNVDISNLGNVPGEFRTIEDYLSRIGIKDKDFIDKVIENICGDITCEGYYLGEDVANMAKQYDLEKGIVDGTECKVLTPKK